MSANVAPPPPTPKIVTFTEYLKGKKVETQVIVPDGQIWLFHILDEQIQVLDKQTKLLETIRTAALWVAFIITILLVITIFHL